jgi:hypothetical protein
MAVVLAGAFLSACAGSPGLPAIANAKIDDSNALEFTGAVDSIAAEAWSVGGLTVGISASTHVSGNPQVGDLVTVQARLLGPDSLMASEIALADSSGSIEEPSSSETPSVDATPAPDQEVEFVGPIVSMGSDQWTIGDRTVAVNSDSEIKGAPAVGDVMKVHAVVQADLSLLATEIEPASESDAVSATEGTPSAEVSPEPEDTPEPEEDLAFKGTVQAIDGDHWTVSGVVFVVPSTATIEGTIGVGDTVEIHAVRSTDGTLTATKVKLEDESSPQKIGDDSSDDSHDSGGEDHSGDSHDDSSSGDHGGESGGGSD